MNFVVVFGRSYYIIDGIMPKFAQYRLNRYVNKWGNNLDLAPNWVRHKANYVLRKFPQTVEAVSN